MNYAGATTDSDHPPDRGPTVLWKGPALQRVGYGTVSDSALLALDAGGVHVAADPMGVDPGVLRDHLVDAPALARWSRLLRPGATPEVVVVALQAAARDGAPRFSGVRRDSGGDPVFVGLTMFEADRLPPGWAEECNQMDRVWVPSSFNQRVFLEAGVDPARIEVVAPGIRTGWLTGPTVPYEVPGADAVFLSVFRWQHRKGPDILLEAYVREFARDEGTLLVLRTYLSESPTVTVDDLIERQLAELGVARDHAPRIMVLDQPMDEATFSSLYRAATAFVLPTRGEGLGMPFLEAMAAGVPVIATAWSGQLDFLHEDNAYLIEIDGLEAVGEAFGPALTLLDPPARWAAPSVEHTRELLRTAATDGEGSQALARRARDEVLADWTVEASVDRYVSAVARAAKPTRRSGPRGVAAAPAPVVASGGVFGVSGASGDLRGLLAALESAGIEVAARHISGAPTDAGLGSSSRRQLTTMVRRDHVPEPLHLIAVPVGPLRADPTARASIGRTGTLPDPAAEWHLADLRSLDQLWVPSAWHRDHYLDAGVPSDRMFIVPTPVDPCFRPDAAGGPGQEGPAMTFLATGPWDERKGWRSLVTAFAHEIGARDAARLLLRPRGVHPLVVRRRLVDWLAEGSRPGAADRIEVDCRSVPQHELPAIYRAADVLVAAGAQEHFGRTLREAAACGLGVIATAPSLRAANLDAARAVAHRTGGRGFWWPPEIEDLRAHLRRAVEGGVRPAVQVEPEPPLSPDSLLRRYAGRL